MAVCGHDCESDSKMQYYRPFDNKIDKKRFTVDMFNAKLIERISNKKTKISRCKHQTRYGRLFFFANIEHHCAVVQNH